MVAAIDTTTPALNSRFRSPSAVIA